MSCVWVILFSSAAFYVTKVASTKPVGTRVTTHAASEEFGGTEPKPVMRTHRTLINAEGQGTVVADMGITGSKMALLEELNVLNQRVVEVNAELAKLSKDEEHEASIAASMLDSHQTTANPYTQRKWYGANNCCACFANWAVTSHDNEFNALECEDQKALCLSCENWWSLGKHFDDYNQARAGCVRKGFANSCSKPSHFHACPNSRPSVLPTCPAPSYVHVGAGACLDAQNTHGTHHAMTSNNLQNCRDTCDSEPTCAGFDNRETGCIWYRNMAITHANGDTCCGGLQCYKKQGFVPFTGAPTDAPTMMPTDPPTEMPTDLPTMMPTAPTHMPTAPTHMPTAPTHMPTEPPIAALATPELELCKAGHNAGPKNCWDAACEIAASRSKEQCQHWCVNGGWTEGCDAGDSCLWPPSDTGCPCQQACAFYHNPQVPSAAPTNANPCGFCEGQGGYSNYQWNGDRSHSQCCPMLNGGWINHCLEPCQA